MVQHIEDDDSTLYFGNTHKVELVCLCGSHEFNENINADDESESYECRNCGRSVVVQFFDKHMED